MHLSQALPARRLALQRGASKANLLGTVPAVKSLDETRALISFLSSNVSLFRPAAMSTAALRRLVQRCSLVAIKADEVAAGRYVYVRGGSLFYDSVKEGSLMGGMKRSASASASRAPSRVTT